MTRAPTNGAVARALWLAIGLAFAAGLEASFGVAHAGGRAAVDAGTVSREPFAEVADAHAYELSNCWRWRKQSVPSLEGRVTLAWRVTGAGAPIEASLVESTLKDADAEACMVERVRGWRFPATGQAEPAFVTYRAMFPQASAVASVAMQAPAPSKPQVPSAPGLSQEQIAATITEHTFEVRSCYEWRLESNPALSGTLKVGWHVLADGSTADVHFEDSTLNDPKTEDCVIARVKGWRFPRPQGGGMVAVSFPWVLRPSGHDGGLR